MKGGRRRGGGGGEGRERRRTDPDAISDGSKRMTSLMHDEAAIRDLSLRHRTARTSADRTADLMKEAAMT
eukprot:3641667-Rhodomonas_salina.1